MSFIPMSSTDKRHCPSKLTSSSSNVSLVTSHRTLVSSTSRILKSTSTIAAKSDSHSFLNKKPLNCSGTPKEPAKRISSSSSISTSTTSSSFQSSTASPSSATSNTSTTPSILSFSKISKSTDWNERSKSLESVSEYVNDISNELVSKQKRLQDLFIQGLKDKHPKVVQKTMGVIEDYLKRPDSLPLLMQSRENHIDDDNPSNVTQSIPTALGMEFLGNMLPLILVNSVVMPTNSNRGSIAEAGMNVIFLFKMKFGSKHLCSAITSIINNPHWCENTKISFGCIVLLSILDIGELEIYCRKKTAFRALLNGIGGFCTERDSGMVKNIKVLLAQLFISTGSVAFLEAYSKITSQKRKAVARIFGIRHGDINNDLKAFEASVTVELKAKKPPAAPPNKPSSNNQDLLKAISDTTRRPAAELQTARVGLETKLSAATINSVVHSQRSSEQNEEEDAGDEKEEEDEESEQEDIISRFNHVSPSLEDLQDLVRRRNRSPSSSTENLAETTPILSLPNRLVPINRKYIDTSTNLLLNTPIKEFLPDQYIYDAASRLGQVGWNFFKVAMAALISVISLILKLSIVAIGYAVSAVKDKAAAGKIKLQETTNSFQASVTRLYSNEDLRADAISDSKFESSIATAVTTTANSNSNDFSSFSSIKAAGHGNGRQSETGDWKNHNSENIADIKYDFDYHEDELESIEKHEEMQEKSELNFSRPQRTSGIIYTPTNGSGSNSSSSTSSTSMSCYNHQKLEKRNHGTDFDSDTAISPDQPEQTLNLLSSPNERLISSISGNNNSLSRVQLKKPIDSGSSSKPAEHPSQLPFEDRTPPRSASKVHSNVIMSSTTSNSIISASSRTVDEAWGEKPTLGNNPAEPAPTFTGSIITVTMIKNSNPPKKRGILRRSFQGAAWFVPILGWRVNRVIDDVLEGIEKPDGLAHLHVVNV